MLTGADKICCNCRLNIHCPIFEKLGFRHGRLLTEHVCQLCSAQRSQLVFVDRTTESGRHAYEAEKRGASLWYRGVMDLY